MIPKKKFLQMGLGQQVLGSCPPTLPEHGPTPPGVWCQLAHQSLVCGFQFSMPNFAHVRGVPSNFFLCKFPASYSQRVLMGADSSSECNLSSSSVTWPVSSQIPVAP